MDGPIVTTAILIGLRSARAAGRIAPRFGASANRRIDMATVEDVLLDKGSDVITALPTATVSQAARKMVEANVGCLLVEEDDEIVGIITERDLMRRVIDAGKDPATTTVRDIMSSPVETCSPGDDVDKCHSILANRKFRHLVVMDNSEPAGVISLRDLPAWRA